MNAQTLKETLAGAQLTLLDEQILEHFSFHTRDSGVAATLGTHGGPVCGPLLRYEVRGDGTVELTDGASIRIIWEQVELTGEVLTARCGGRLKRFGFTPGKKQVRYLP